MPDLPEEALAAAAEALAVHFNPANTMSVGAETRAALVESWELEARLTLEAAAPVLAAQVRQQVTEEILTRLRRLAAGRREYANGAPAEMRHLLLCEADVLDAAVKVANGSKLTMMGMIPTWWWGDDEGQVDRQIGEAQ